MRACLALAEVLACEQNVLRAHIAMGQAPGVHEAQGVAQLPSMQDGGLHTNGAQAEAMVCTG